MLYISFSILNAPFFEGALDRVVERKVVVAIRQATIVMGVLSLFIAVWSVFSAHCVSSALSPTVLNMAKSAPPKLLAPLAKANATANNSEAVKKHFVGSLLGFGVVRSLDVSMFFNMVWFRIGCRLQLFCSDTINFVV